MSLHVEGEVITARELPLAEMALEGLGTSVLPVVPRQLVRPGKLPAAPVPRALVRLLPRVGPLVRLQVRALCVHLVAAGKVAAMHLPFSQAVPVAHFGAAPVGGRPRGGRYHQLLRARRISENQNRLLD